MSCTLHGSSQRTGSRSSSLMTSQVGYDSHALRTQMVRETVRDDGTVRTCASRCQLLFQQDRHAPPLLQDLSQITDVLKMLSNGRKNHSGVQQRLIDWITVSARAIGQYPVTHHG